LKNVFFSINQSNIVIHTNDLIISTQGEGVRAGEDEGVRAGEDEGVRAGEGEGVGASEGGCG